MNDTQLRFKLVCSMLEIDPILKYHVAKMLGALKDE